MVLSELNADDQKVFVAISNLIYNGNTKVTRTQLYRFMQQNPNAKPTQSQLERIDQSIRKMASIYLKLDAKALFEIYPDLERIPVGSNFIEVVEWAERRTANGQFSEYYEFKRQLPILWQYSLIVGQMATIQINDRSPYSTKLRNTADNKEIVQIIGDRIL